MIAEELPRDFSIIPLDLLGDQERIQHLNGFLSHLSLRRLEELNDLLHVDKQD